MQVESEWFFVTAERLCDIVYQKLYLNWLEKLLAMQELVFIRLFHFGFLYKTMINRFIIGALLFSWPY
jgi:hypothetical protein